MNQPTDTDAVDSTLIFLDLLEAKPEGLAEPCLAQAQ